MSKKIIPSLLVCMALLAVLVCSQGSRLDSPLLNNLNEEESMYGQELCIDPDTGEINVLMEEYAQPLEAMVENPGSVFPVDTEYLQKLSVVVEERKKLVDGLIKSDGIKKYRDLAAGNPLGDFVKVKVLPVMEGAGDIVRVSTELFRDASGQALSMSTAPLTNSFQIKTAAEEGAKMSIMFNGMMGQLASNGELEKAVDYAAGIITQQTQAQNTISTAHSYMNLAGEGAKSASNMFALAESLADKNPGLAQKITTIGMFQMAQALAGAQEAAKLKMLVLFMLLNDIHFNKMRYGALMTALGSPCDLDPYPPCPGCPFGFYAFIPQGCSAVGPYPPGMPPLPGGAGGSGGGGGGGGGGDAGAGGASGGLPPGSLSSMAVVSGCDGSPLTGAASAGQSLQGTNTQEVLPRQVFTEFPSFKFSIETPEIVPVVAEPKVTNVITNYIKKLSASKIAFVKEKIKGARMVNSDLYLGKKQVEVSLNGALIDSSGKVIDSLGPDFGRTYSEFRFAEKRLEQVKTVAEIESKPYLSPVEQAKYIKAYRDMMRADLRLLDLLYNHELEKIQSSEISNEAKQAKMSALNMKHANAKVDAFESAISDSRLIKFLGKVPGRSAKITELMKKRNTNTNSDLILQVTDDQELAGYYVELKQSI